MTANWNDELFENFVRLRNALRTAKKDKDYQLVLSIGLTSLELDKSASFLQIETPIFHKDMADACIKLGDITSAIAHLVSARAGFEIRRHSSIDWQKNIEVIDEKLEKLKGKK